MRHSKRSLTTRRDTSEFLLYYDIAETNFDVMADDFLDLASKLNG